MGGRGAACSGWDQEVEVMATKICYCFHIVLPAEGTFYLLALFSFTVETSKQLLGDMLKFDFVSNVRIGVPVRGMGIGVLNV